MTLERLGQDAAGVEEATHPAEQVRAASLEGARDYLGRVDRCLDGELAVVRDWVLEAEHHGLA